jgi:hypothetical protein
VQRRQDFAFDVRTEQCAAANAERARRPAQQDAGYPTFGLLVTTRIAAARGAQRAGLVRRKAQIFGAQREHRPVDHEASHRQRWRFARRDHDLPVLG